VLEGMALWDGPEMPVHVRVAGHDGKIYLDLADAGWRAVEVRPDGWDVVTAPPVRFRRPRGMLPLPAPTRGGSLATLRELVNVRDDGGRMMVVAWMLAALRPRGPYPVLVLTGEQGAAKTSVGRVICGTIDPSVASLRCEPRDARDLMIAA